MVGTIQRVAFSLVAVFVGGWFYSLLVVPLVEGAAKPVSDQPRFLGATDNLLIDNAVELAPYLPPDAWELQPQKKLQLDQGSAFFQDWEPLPDGRLEVKPFTLVLKDRDEVGGGELPPKSPIFLRAPDGAVLEFDRPFQHGLGPSGKLVGATLRGEVKIFRKPVNDAAEALEITTRNIQIQSNRIFTPHRVEFRMGPHQGRGQNLAIQLLADRPTAKGKVAKIRGIESLELFKLDYLSLAVPQKTAASAGLRSPEAVLPAEGSPRTVASGKGELPSHILVQCDGPFVMDMVKEAARFEQNVHLAQLDDATQREMTTLDCQQLTIEFKTSKSSEISVRASRDSSSRSAASADAAAAGPDNSKDLEVRRLIAIGQPAVLHSVERDFHAEAEYLSYDPIAKRISMRDQNRVLLLHKDLRFEAPSFDYDLDEGRKLGTASAVGAGRMVRIPGIEHAGLEVSWEEELQLRPHEGLHALSLYGNPQLRMGREGQFSAQELHVWLQEATPAATAPGNAGSTQIEPVKLLAQGRVEIDSPKLAGGTERLEVFWDSPDDASPATAAQPPAANSSNAAGGPSLAGEPPTSMNPLLGSKQAEQPARKMIVTGDFIRARLKPDQDSFSVDEITIEGQARLVEQPQGEPNSDPLTIAGKRLQVNSLGNNLYAAYVVSEDVVNGGGAVQETSTLAARGMELFGQQLQLNQAQHRMWMDGAGEARLHATPAQKPKADLTGPVIVRWQGGLDFDGQLVRIRDQVSIWLQTTNKQGNLSTVQLQGERLDIRLTKKIDLAASDETPKDESKADVETLILGGQVLITHWETRPDGQWQAVDRLTAKGAGVDYQTGNLLAGGPGVAQSIRMKGAFDALPGSGPASAKETADNSTLTHVRIEFARSIEGNIFDKRMAFVEQVQVFSDEVPTWDSWLDREQLQRSATMVYLRSDQLQLEEVMTTRNSPPSWLVKAIGNAYLTGRGVEASATRMMYDQGKDLLTLAADGRDDAQLTRQAQPGGQRDFVRAREIKFWRTLNQVEVDGVSSISSNARVGKAGDGQPRATPGGIRRD